MKLTGRWLVVVCALAALFVMGCAADKKSRSEQPSTARTVQDELPISSEAPRFISFKTHAVTLPTRRSEPQTGAGCALSAEA